jgi:uncharacterized membrane protein (UPF0127 family)
LRSIPVYLDCTFHRPILWNLQKLRVNNVTRGKLLADRAAIANTSSTRRTGLLKHTRLDAGDGLWIVPSEGVHTFGMKFAIDVLFLDKKRRVKKMRPNMVRGKIAFSLLSHSTLELPAGTIAETGTQAGDQLEIEKYEA